MVIARRGDGSLVFYNAIPLDDETLAEVRTWGRPGWLVIANVFHMIDAHAFRERLGVKLLCAAAAADRARARAPVDGSIEHDLPTDPQVGAVALPAAQGESALVVSGADGTSVAFGDAFMNVPHQPGAMNRLMSVLGFSGRPKCPPVFRLAFGRDRPALARAMLALAALPGLVRLIPSHGDIIDTDAAAILRDAVTRDLGPG